MVRWLGLRAFSAVAQVQSLARELRLPPAEGVTKRNRSTRKPHPPQTHLFPHDPTHLDRGQSLSFCSGPSVSSPPAARGSPRAPALDYTPSSAQDPQVLPPLSGSLGIKPKSSLRPTGPCTPPPHPVPGLVSSLFPSVTLLQPRWPPHCSSNKHTCAFIYI